MQPLLFNTIFLDDMNVSQIFKDNGKLNRIIKNLPDTQVKFYFFFAYQYLFINFIFEKRMF